VRQLLIETLILSGAGAALGLLVSTWSTAVLMPLVNGQNSHSGIDAALDRNVVLFAGLLATATGVLFGLLPAWRATRARLSLLSGSERSLAMISSRRQIGAGRPSRALVVAQVALAIALLVGAGLFAETLGGLRKANLGIDKSHLLLIWVGGSTVSGSSNATTAARFALLQERLSALPGVMSASGSEEGILSDWDNDGASSDQLSADGVQVRPGFRLTSNTVGPGFFTTVGSALVAGRDFTPADSSRADYEVIISEALSRFVFGAANPLGHRLLINCRNCVPMEVVGVARDITQAGPRVSSFGTIYEPGRTSNFRAATPMFFAVRTAGDPMSQAAAVRQTIGTFAPEVPVLRIQTVDARLDTLLSTDRMMALLGGALSGLALMLAAVGLYGVISYAVVRRRSEISLRMVLGATRWRIVGMVGRDHAALLAAGVTLGWLLAQLGSQLVTSRLYGVTAGDPRAYVSAIGSLVAVALIATLLPAWQASRLDPAQTLRSE